MPVRSRTRGFHASFSTTAAAESAAAALIEAGIPGATVRLQHGVLPEALTREARFVSRVLVAIVLWSVVGAAPGAALGWLLAETIGPGGTGGLILQVVCWTIVGHLIGGMLAGYLLLADRSAEEMPPDRPVSLLTIRDLPEADVRRVRRVVRASDPLDVRIVHS